MARTDTLGHFLTDVADAIREKSGTSEAIQASSFDTAIANIPSGGNDYFSETLSGTSLSGEIGIANSIISLPTFTVSTTDFNRAFYNCKNLVEIPLLDTSTVTLMSETFFNCKTITTIPLLNTSNVTTFNSCFYGCSNLETLPQLDTSKVTNFQFAFSQCTRLKNIPVFNFSSATNLTRPFQGTNILTDESLNNLLASCISATSYIRTKTLSELGLTSSYYPASRIQALSNYQDFIDAGWTIGY